MKETAIYALTNQGARLGRHLADQLQSELFLPAHLSKSFGGIPFDSLMDVIANQFSHYPRQIFIAATGIVVRAIAPHLTSKDQDPAVVVLDQQGDFVISLLSGHLGGANELAREVAGLTGGKAVITTGTDTAGVLSIDILAQKRNMSIANIEAVKWINGAILAGDPIQIFDPEDRLGLKTQEVDNLTIEWVEKEENWSMGYPGVWVTWGRKKPGLKELVLHPRCLIAGIGCNRGTPFQEIIGFITDTFNRNSLSLKSLKCLTTIEAKKHEKGLLDAAREFGAPLITFRASDLDSIEVPNPSGTVKKYIGVSSVCEATALLKAGTDRLLVPKTKNRDVTVAIALES